MASKNGKLNKRELRGLALEKENKLLKEHVKKHEENNILFQHLFLKYMRYIHETGNVNVDLDKDYFQDNEYKILKAFQDVVEKEEVES